MRRIDLPIDHVASLAWWGDTLVDWLAGHRWTLDGVHQKFGVGSTYRFDATVGHGDVGVSYERLGTKGRVLRWNGVLPSPQVIPLGVDIVRELDRSYYHADDYSYPVCVLALPDGRTAIAHCPRSYDRLELELVDGTALTARSTPRPADVFHSRLEASPDGRWLLSSGWVWQPWNVACVYDVARALREPTHLDGSGLPLDLGSFGDDCEADAATLASDRLVAVSEGERRMAVVDLATGAPLADHHLAEPAGSRLMAWGADHVVALDGAPRLYALATGAIEHRWDDLDGGAGVWQPSVRMAPAAAPYVARDPGRQRFAIAWPRAGEQPGRLTIVSAD